MKPIKTGNSIVIIKQGKIEQVIKKEPVHNIGMYQTEYEITLEDAERKITICKGLNIVEVDEEMEELYRNLKSTQTTPVKEDK